MKAVRENRVLTVNQEPASKRKDFGEIGFHRHKHASYFVFPRALKKDPGRVIGINYDLVSEPEESDRSRRRKEADPLEISDRSASLRPPLQKKRTPVFKEFEVTVRQVASNELVLSIRAPDKETARARALNLAAEKSIDLKSAAIRNEVESIR